MGEETRTGGTIVVTGACGGIGRAVARRLGETGHVVAGWDSVAPDPADAAPWLRSTCLDVRDKAAMEDAVRALEGSAPPVRGLVACAAVFPAAAFLDLNEAAWDLTVDVNLKGYFLACQAVVPAMIRHEGGGSIVLFSSTLASTGRIGAAHYAATKAGIRGLAHALARELAPTGIRVNTVSPGLTETPPIRRGMPGPVLARRGSEVPLGRLGQPEDMAEAVLFLLQDGSAFITGQDIQVDGGELML